jgi:hypothetical protein
MPLATDPVLCTLRADVAETVQHPPKSIVDLPAYEMSMMNDCVLLIRGETLRCARTLSVLSAK